MLKTNYELIKKLEKRIKSLEKKVKELQGEGIDKEVSAEAQILKENKKLGKGIKTPNRTPKIEGK